MASLRLHLLFSAGSDAVRSSLPGPPPHARRSSIACPCDPVYDNLNDLLSLGPHRIWKEWQFRGAVRWVEGDATDLPFSDGHFDAITMRFGLRNVVDKYKAMEEMFRVLKAGSRVPIIDFNKSTNPVVSAVQELMIDNLVVPVASGSGLEEDYKYLKSSVRAFLTGDELEKLALDVGFSNAPHGELSSHTIV